MAEVNTTTVGGVADGANAVNVNDTAAGNQAGQETQTQTIPTQTQTAEANGSDGQAEQTFTQADLDRRVQQALDTAKGKWQSELADRIQREREDAAHLAQMSEKEKAEELAKRQQANFDTERAKFERQRSVFGAQQVLADRKLPLSFAEILAGKDEQATTANIDAFEKAFNAAVQSAVVEKMKGGAPQTGGALQNTETDPFLQGFGK